MEECVFGLEDGGGWHLARFIYWKIHAHMMNDVMAIGFSRGRLGITQSQHYFDGSQFT